MSGTKSTLVILNKKSDWEHYRLRLRAWAVKQNSTVVLDYDNYDAYLTAYMRKEQADRGRALAEYEAKLAITIKNIKEVNASPKKLKNELDSASDSKVVDLAASDDLEEKLESLKLNQQVLEKRITQLKAKASTDSSISDEQFLSHQHATYDAIHQSLGPEFVHLIATVREGDAGAAWRALQSYFERDSDENHLNIVREFFQLNETGCGGLSKLIAEIERYSRILEGMKTPPYPIQKLLVLYDGVRKEELKDMAKTLMNLPTRCSFENACKKLLDRDESAAKAATKSEPTEEAHFIKSRTKQPAHRRAKGSQRGQAPAEDEKTNRSSTGKWCAICKLGNHNTAECKAKCANCANGGHQAVDCPKPRRSSEDRPCFKCKKNGHTMSECVEEQSNFVAEPYWDPYGTNE